MRDNRFFLQSTELGGSTPATVGGSPAVLSYGAVIDRLEAIAGRDAAAIFAEPVLPAGEAAGAAAVSWYSSRDGALIELDAIDVVARRPVAERLARHLAEIGHALADPEIGATISTWLNVRSPRNILSIGGEPVIIGWGCLPAEVADDPVRRRDHFARMLGRFAPQLPIPDMAANGGPASSSPSLPSDPVDAGAADDSGYATREGPRRGEASRSPMAAREVVAVDPSPPPVIVVVARDRPWLAPAVASLLAALVLAFLFVPGVLIYPSGSAGDTFEAERLRVSNDSLDAQLQALEATGRDRVCRADGATIPVPRAGNSGDVSPPRMEAVPRPPDRVPVPPSSAGPATGATTLAELLEGATVLVLAPTEAGLSQGTGFLIADRLIVTNHHVVEGARTVIVANKAIGGARRARVVALSDPPPSESDLRVDLAVLELEPDPSRPRLKLGPKPAKLSTAYVAGFPGFLLERDAGFSKWMTELTRRLQASNDPDAAIRELVSPVPGADLRSGRINNLMSSGARSLPILVHDMQLAKGNSGGPLIDACGRLIGINTLLFASEQTSQQGNVAQDASLLQRFLTDRNIAFELDETVCAFPGQPATPAALPSSSPATPPAPPPPPAPVQAPAR